MHRARFSRRLPIRWVGVVVLAVALSGLVVVVVAAGSLGFSAAREELRERLDAAHVWGPRTEHLRRARDYAHGDPEADALEAIARNDRRLLAIAGVGASAPGVPELDFDAHARQYGVQYLYAGCVAASQEESQFRAAAFAYAERYNRVIAGSVAQ